MRILSYLLFLKKVLTKQTLIQNLKSKIPNGIARGVGIVLVLILSAGCSQTSLTARQLPALLPDLSATVNFQFRVTPSNQAGVYALAGSTNLPDESRITVAAVRYLHLDKSLSRDKGLNPTYSILAYQDVRVNQGKWRTNLNLWKVAPNGQFQEAWQLDRIKLGLTLTPEPDVTFVATADPTNSLSKLEQQLQKQGIKLVRNVVRNTSDGEQYVQATQVLTVGLPTGQTTPPPQRLEDVNGGWGPRYLLVPEPPNTNKFEQPSKRRTTAPLSPTELMQ